MATISVPGVVDLTYTYDALKRKTAEGDSILGDQVLGYDAANRLTNWARVNDIQQSWQLSLVGNWLSVTQDGQTETRSHSAVHEVSERVNPIGGGANQTLSHDYKGNLVDNGRGGQYSWDVENRLLAAPSANANYRYDALGRRVQKTVDGWSTTFVHFGAQVFTEIGHAAVPSQAAVTAEGSLSGLAAAPEVGGLITGATGEPGQGVVRVNFQPPTAAIPDGFVADKGRVLAARAIADAPGLFTYGWDAVPDTHARGTPLPPAADTLAELAAGAEWEMALPNGDYPVLIVAGDAMRRDRSNHLRVNGQFLEDPTPNPGPDGYLNGEFDVWAVMVTVSDGRLVISADATAEDASLVWVEIGEPGQALPDPADVADLAAQLTESTWQLPPNDGPEPSRRSYVYGSYVDQPLMTIDELSGTKLYYHADHLYSVSAITDSDGVVVERYKYNAYGERTVYDASGITELDGSVIGQPYGFTGRRYDAETGLWYFRARYYSAEMGRFVSRDPLGYVDGMSMYLR